MHKKNIYLLSLLTTALVAQETLFLEVEGVYAPSSVERIQSEEAGNSTFPVTNTSDKEESQGFRVALGKKLYSSESYSVDASIGMGVPFIAANQTLLDSEYQYLALDIIMPLNKKWSIDVNAKAYRYSMFNNNILQETDFGINGTASVGVKLFYTLDGYSLSFGYEYLKNPNFEQKQTYPAQEEDGQGNILSETEVTQTDAIDIGGGYLSFGIKVPF